MNQDEIPQRIIELEQQVVEISKSLKRIKKIFKWAIIVSVALLVLPLIGLVIAIPSYLNTLDTINSF